MQDHIISSTDYIEYYMLWLQRDFSFCWYSVADVIYTEVGEFFIRSNRFSIPHGVMFPSREWTYISDIASVLCESIW